MQSGTGIRLPQPGASGTPLHSCGAYVVVVPVVTLDVVDDTLVVVVVKLDVVDETLVVVLDKLVVVDDALVVVVVMLVVVRVALVVVVVMLVVVVSVVVEVCVVVAQSSSTHSLQFDSMLNPGSHFSQAVHSALAVPPFQHPSLH